MQKARRRAEVEEEEVVAEDEGEEVAAAGEVAEEVGVNINLLKYQKANFYFKC